MDKPRKRLKKNSEVIAISSEPVCTLKDDKNSRFSMEGNNNNGYGHNQTLKQSQFDVKKNPLENKNVDLGRKNVGMDIQNSKKRSFQQISQSKTDENNNFTSNNSRQNQTANEQQAQSSSEEEVDPYPRLKPASKHHFGSDNVQSWRYNPDTQEYHLPDFYSLPGKVYENLLKHQKEGVRWLYDLYSQKKGGCLGDDMGLGKTVQISAYLKGLFDSGKIKRVLVAVPASTKIHWLNELEKWCFDTTNIIMMDDKKKQEREKQMKIIRREGGIIISSFGMVTTERLNLGEVRYDVLVVDEGHKAKNVNTELRRNLVSMRVRGHRLALSGTPLQNNLQELWSVFDLVQPKIFGSYHNFTQQYAANIEKGLLKDASYSEKNLADKLSLKVRQMYEPHFLRRTKNTVFSVVCAETANRPLKMTELPLKTDLVIWLPLTKQQVAIYQFLIQNQDLQQVVANRSIQNAFFLLSYIKKLCLHPYLLAAAAMEKKSNLGLLCREEDRLIQIQQAEQEAQRAAWGSIKTRRQRGQKEEPEKKKQEKEEIIKQSLQESPSKQKSREQRFKLFDKFNMKEIMDSIKEAGKSNIQNIIQYSSKFMFLFELLENLKQEGHRVLIFSMSKKFLNMIEELFDTDKYRGKYKHMRIDGDTEISSREALCKQFNSDTSIFCGLLTTKVGGLGLNLTGADRAIIMDPDWNPANDNQAVDRVFRIGQKRDVIVYRLVTMGGIEEKIYRRQIFKKGINMKTIDSSSAEAQSETEFQKYFKDSDLFELFEFSGENSSNTCETLDMLLEKHGFNFEQTPTNIKHIDYLQSLEDLIKGISLNSNLYNKAMNNSNEQSYEDDSNLGGNNTDQEFNKKDDASVHESESSDYFVTTTLKKSAIERDNLRRSSRNNNCSFNEKTNQEIDTNKRQVAQKEDLGLAKIDHDMDDDEDEVNESDQDLTVLEKARLAKQKMDSITEEESSASIAKQMTTTTTTSLSNQQAQPRKHVLAFNPRLKMQAMKQTVVSEQKEQSTPNPKAFETLDRFGYHGPSSANLRRPNL